MLCEAFLFANIKLLASVNNVTFASQFNRYAVYDFKPNANAILSRIYEHLFKSVALKCLLFTATSSHFPSFSLNKQADAATLLASVYITKLSVGSGIVNLKIHSRNPFKNLLWFLFNLSPSKFKRISQHLYFRRENCHFFDQKLYCSISSWHHT